MPDRLFNIETKAGEPQAIRDYKVTFFSQVISLKIPGLKGLAAWVRPVSVLVEDGNGEEKVLPIADVTRIAQWSLLGFGLTLPLLLILINRASRRN